MFSATITGKIKRVLFDNDKDGKDAMMKISMEVKKQFIRDDDMPNIYPTVTVFGHDAAYIRQFAGEGHWLHVFNAEYDVYKDENKVLLDEDNDKEYPREFHSFKAGKIELLPKQMSEAVEETIEGGDDDGGRKGKSRGKSSRNTKGKSRSDRRKRSNDDEEEAPKGRSKRRGKASDGAKKPSRSKSRKPKDDDYEEEYDDDYDDEYDDDDDWTEDDE